MTIQTLHDEMVVAWKAKNKFRKDTLAELIGAVKKAGIDAKVKDNIPESLVDSVLLKEKKLTQEMIDTCPAARTDALQEYQNRMTIINEFAPKLLEDPDEIRAIVVATLNANNIEPVKANKGAVMKLISSDLKGKADMRQVNIVVSNLLV